MHRRDFLASTLAAAVAPTYAAAPRSKLCIFSKAFGALGWDELGRTCFELGADVDLTVRPGGHVLPDRVEQDLPRAAEALARHDVRIAMISTGLTDASDPAALPTFRTAGRLGIRYLKPGYWQYGQGGVDASIAECRRSVAALAALGAGHGVHIGLHNHSGDRLGAAVWDYRAVLDGVEPGSCGYYFDPMHATVEGGGGGWKIALELAVPRLKMVALKDFSWERREGGWRAAPCPLGQGVVRWPRVFARLEQAGFQGPVSVHVEYSSPDLKAAAGRDLDFARRGLQHLLTAAG